MSVSAANSPQFYPPRLNPTFTRLCQSISYPVGRLLYHFDLQIDPASLDKLKALEGERVVLLPNHPTLDDGIALFVLSARTEQLFNYMVAHDNFSGLLGKFLQCLGAYSIKRGIGDRHSVAFTLNLLKEPGCHLVIFPEGGCSYQNDTVMPFRSGAIQLPLQAMHKLAKQEGKPPNFYLVPVSLKYRYQGDMTPKIEELLNRLEEALQISPPSQDFYQRLRAVAERVLGRLEQEYDLVNAKTDRMDWNDRIAQLKTHVLRQCEQKLEIAPPENTPIRERVYKIQSILESRAQESEAGDLYEAIDKAAKRLLNFDAIYDGYVADAPTQERFLDTLTRLEREVFDIDRPRAKGHRQLFVRIGNPVNLQEHYESFQDNRVETIESLRQSLQQVVQGNLDVLNRR